MLRRAHTHAQAGTSEHSQSRVHGRKQGTARTGAKPIDNFLTQSRVKERNEKHQKRKKERKE